MHTAPHTQPQPSPPLPRPPPLLQVLVGFADKLRLMTVLMEDLRTIKEFGIKGCRECVFSTGGQFFAAVNGTTVSIYNTYTCENVGNLRGHNGKVRGWEGRHAGRGWGRGMWGRGWEAGLGDLGRWEGGWRVWWQAAVASLC